MIVYNLQTDVALRDSLAIERARSPEEFSRIVGDIEARHRVEGISAESLAAWENVKTQHALRIVAVMAA